MITILKIVLIITLTVYYVYAQYGPTKGCGQLLTDPAAVVTKNGWVAMVYRKDQTDVKKDPIDNKCLASIIKDNWLVGAASCFTLKDDQYMVKIPNNMTKGPFHVDKIYKSKEYNPTLGAGYDLALIKLKNGLQLKVNPKIISAICLSDYGFDSAINVNSNCSLDSCDTPGHLISEQIVTKDEGDCKKLYPKYKEGYMFCGNIPVHWLNSGAPVTCKDSNLQDKGPFFLSAMASWGRYPDDYKKVKDIDKADVYTKLYGKHYISWIQKTIEEDESHSLNL
ncbi:unnamed protein product [Oppiella nova]|uniref:Peptidase S1 domain-containing protein n=1 Tax=Oppiella nova TaxID=334625 RepID=A0A7R9M5N7_9ACAR|nr:unnamed protein product [Oppiella nova]CAG2171231.1 unnamed protein product [Oppiella nova]